MLMLRLERPILVCASACAAELLPRPLLVPAHLKLEHTNDAKLKRLRPEHASVCDPFLRSLGWRRWQPQLPFAVTVIVTVKTAGRTASALANQMNRNRQPLPLPVRSERTSARPRTQSQACCVPHSVHTYTDQHAVRHTTTSRPCHQHQSSRGNQMRVCQQRDRDRHECCVACVCVSECDKIRINKQ